MLEALRSRGRPLLVEAGNFMEIDLPVAERVNALILDRLEAEGVAVLTPGPRELSHWSEFRSLVEAREIPVVQANVEVSEGGGFAPVGRGSAVLTVEGVRVGVIGVIGEPQFQKIRAPEGVEFRFRDPAVAVEEQAAALRPQAELIVVVGCVTDGEAADLARRVGGVDVWVSGYDSIPSDRPVPAGEQTLLCRTGQRGQYLSVTQLIVSPSGAIVEHGGRNIPLDARVPTDAGVDALVTQLLGETATRGCR